MPIKNQVNRDNYLHLSLKGFVEWGVTANTYGISFVDDENVVNVNSGNFYATL